MILTLIGLIINFIGTFVIIIETVSGLGIRPKIYQFAFRGVYGSRGNGKVVKIKLEPKEKRILCWLILICIGFLFQILDFMI